MLAVKIAIAVVVIVAFIGLLKRRKPGPTELLPNRRFGIGPPLSAEGVVAELRQAGLVDIADRVQESMLPCFFLVDASSDNPGPCRSQIGGLPDLPDPAVWPRHQGKSLSFVAQINLAELPDDAPATDLSKTGMFYFFYDCEKSAWGYDPKDKGSWRVLYAEHPPEGPPELTFPDDIPEHARYARTVVEIVSGRSIPDTFDVPPGSDLSVEQKGLIDDLLARHVYARSPVHQLLGHPITIQGDMHLECQFASHGLPCGPGVHDDPRAKELESGALDWQLLLQIDSDDAAGMMWVDLGTLYFWIRSEDLRERNFEGVWMILQCS